MEGPRRVSGLVLHLHLHTRHLGLLARETDGEPAVHGDAEPGAGLGRAERSAFPAHARLLSYLSSSGVILSICSAVLTKQIDTLTMGREAVLRMGHTATAARGWGRRADNGAGGGLDLPGLQALGGLQHLGPDPTQLHNHARLASARYLVSTLIFLISRSSLPPESRPRPW